MLPHVRSGSKPARIAQPEEQSQGRAEFFALPYSIHFRIYFGCGTIHGLLVQHGFG
jgi:hypothetical protein